ncbi:sce7726 family protein [Thalassospira sp.]|uniref:sce7726 family protein n=1 Tax=Thalassospira sp. TaxID=1912094 RepID=UPI0025FAF54A|nr:sce7726 family protein [Thalassospira sp.]
MYLSDSTIRKELIDRLQRRGYDKSELVEELRIHDGKAIADVVACNQATMHCYEIKSDLDKIERVIEQATYFNLAFSKLTLVTTEKHLARALEVAPDFWGIILVRKRATKIVLKAIRKHSYNPFFCKNKALKALWKDELIDLLSRVQKAPKKLNRAELAEELSARLTKQKVNVAISEKIRLRSITTVNPTYKLREH